MSTKLTNPADLLNEMDEPIRTVRGAHDALVSMGFDGLATVEGVKFVADGVWPAVKRLEELSEQWARVRDTRDKKEG